MDLHQRMRRDYSLCKKLRMYHFTGSSQLPWEVAIRPAISQVKKLGTEVGRRSWGPIVKSRAGRRTQAAWPQAEAPNHLVLGALHTLAVPRASTAMPACSYERQSKKCQLTAQSPRARKGHSWGWSSALQAESLNWTIKQRGFMWKPNFQTLKFLEAIKWKR